MTFTYYTPDKHELLVEFTSINNEPVITSITWHCEDVLPLLKQGYSQLFDNIEEQAWKEMSS